MFGKYFNHVLILTLLAGSAYSLPQVKEAMVGAFGYSDSNTALVMEYKNTNSTQMIRDRIQQEKQRIEKDREEIQAREDLRLREMTPPEEIVATLVKAGIIPREKIDLAVKVLKQQASTTREFRIRNSSSIQTFGSSTPPFGSSTRPWGGRPFASSTPPFSSTTRPRMDDRRNNIRQDLKLPVIENQQQSLDQVVQ